jgi:hypothetical protein
MLVGDYIGCGQLQKNKKGQICLLLNSTSMIIEKITDIRQLFTFFKS